MMVERLNESGPVESCAGVSAVPLPAAASSAGVSPSAGASAAASAVASAFVGSNSTI